MSFGTIFTDLPMEASETGDVDTELTASHQVIQGTGRNLLPPPYDNNKISDVKTHELEDIEGQCSRTQKSSLLLA